MAHVPLNTNKPVMHHTHTIPYRGSAFHTSAHVLSYLSFINVCSCFHEQHTLAVVIILKPITGVLVACRYNERRSTTLFPAHLKHRILPQELSNAALGRSSHRFDTSSLPCRFAGLGTNHRCTLDTGPCTKPSAASSHITTASHYVVRRPTATRGTTACRQLTGSSLQLQPLTSPFPWRLLLTNVPV